MCYPHTLYTRPCHRHTCRCDCYTDTAYTQFLQQGCHGSQHHTCTQIIKSLTILAHTHIYLNKTDGQLNSNAPVTELSNMSRLAATLKSAIVSRCTRFRIVFACLHVVRTLAQLTHACYRVSMVTMSTLITGFTLRVVSTFLCTTILSLTLHVQ
jgi:hypothetical protein